MPKNWLSKAEAMCLYYCKVRGAGNGSWKPRRIEREVYSAVTGKIHYEGGSEEGRRVDGEREAGRERGAQ